MIAAEIHATSSVFNPESTWSGLRSALPAKVLSLFASGKGLIRDTGQVGVEEK
jgi:hypothetical protein